MVKRQGLYYILFSIVIASSIFSVTSVTAKAAESTPTLWGRFTSSVRSLGIKFMLNKCPDYLNFEQKEKLAKLYGLRFMGWLCTDAENKHSNDNQSATVALRLFAILSSKAIENEQLQLPEKITYAMLNQLSDAELAYTLYGPEYESEGKEPFETVTRKGLTKNICNELRYLGSKFFSYENEDDPAASR